MKRLFTFGCSFTSYEWPTWVDFIEHNFDKTYNFGTAGAGNLFIASSLLNCVDTFNITKDDTIIIMLTSSVRYDLLKSNGDWFFAGNVYNCNHYNDDFYKKYWSASMGIQHSLISIELINNILEKIGCTYKIMAAFSNDYTLEAEYNVNTTYNVDLLNKLKKISPIKNLRSFCIEHNKKQTDWYEIKSGNPNWLGFDIHPTILNHFNWVKSELPEYYNEICDNKLKNWEKLIDTDLIILRENFKQIKCTNKNKES